MDQLPLLLILLASVGAFLAGLVDAIVGGGGLIQLPLLIILFPQHSVPLLLGTNKVSMFAGTLVAAGSYAKKLKLPWNILTWALPAAFIGSFVGAWFATILPPGHIKPIIFGLLLLVGIYTFFKPSLGTHSTGASSFTPKQLLLAAAISLLLGAYDGFLGPGTGSFLIFGLIMLLNMNFLTASGCSKWINLMTNLAAICVFAASSNVWWQLALPMAVANIAGGFCGAKLSLKHGSGFVRKVFIVVVVALLMRLGWDLL